MATATKERPTTERTLAGLPITTVAERTDWVKMMVYGMVGSGKTVLAGSAFEVKALSPVLYIDIEGGTKSIRKRYPDIDLIRVRDERDSKTGKMQYGWDKLGKVYEALRADCPYRTIIVDTLSEAQKLCMAQVMAQTLADDPGRDEEVPAQRDWGKNGERVRKMVRAFRDLDAHVIFTAHEDERRDERTGAMMLKPALPGKLRDEVPGFLDEVFYLYTKTAKDEKGKEGITRLLLAQPTARAMAKDRSDAMPAVMENPTMARIVEHVLDTD